MSKDKTTKLINGQRGHKAPHTTMSDQICSHPGCTRRIKLNVAIRKGEGKSLTCYKHFVAKKSGAQNAAS